MSDPGRPPSDPILQYYLEHGVMTDLGSHTPLADRLPPDVATLRDTVQGLLLHVFHAHRLGMMVPEERKSELGLRRAEEMLSGMLALSDGPLRQTRSPERRLVANCRGYAVLMVAFLRQRGIPARARCGFETYYTPGEYCDHWTCEYWNALENRWVAVDPQVDAAQMEAFDFDFDPLDLPPEKFLPAGRVWQGCRRGEIDPEQCGIMELRGLWFVRGNVFRDMMALNKLELLPWDRNAAMESEQEPIERDLEWIDSVAELTLACDARFVEMRSLYQSDGAFRMPRGWDPTGT